MHNAIALMKLAREFAGDDLLNRALEGEAITAESVSGVYFFIAQHFGRDTESEVAKKFWVPVFYFLSKAGLTKEQLQKIRRPFPVGGEPGFRSILDEMYDEGHDVPEELLSPTTKRRSQLEK